MQDRREGMMTSEEFLESHYERRGSPYEVILCDSPMLDKQFSQLRYKVFCEEHPEYQQEYNIDQTETDEFDQQSLRVLLIFRPLQMIIGGMRVIVPDANKNGMGLPCLIHPESPFQISTPFQTESTGEISRFMISRERFKLVRDYYLKVSNSTLEEYPTPIMYLIKQLFDIGVLYNLNGYCAMLEPALIRIVNSVGINFKQYGTPVDCHGKRHVVYVNRDEQLELLRHNNLKARNFFIHDSDISKISDQSYPTLSLYEKKGHNQFI